MHFPCNAEWLSGQLSSGLVSSFTACLAIPTSMLQNSALLPRGLRSHLTTSLKLSAAKECSTTLRTCMLRFSAINCRRAARRFADDLWHKFPRAAVAEVLCPTSRSDLYRKLQERPTKRRLRERKRLKCDISMHEKLITSRLTH